MLLQNNNNDALEQFDKAVRECFSTSLAVDVSDGVCHQAQLGLRHGGLGLCSLSLHASYLNQPPMLLPGYQWFLLSNLVYTWNPMSTRCCPVVAGIGHIGDCNVPFLPGC